MQFDSEIELSPESMFPFIFHLRSLISNGSRSDLWPNDAALLRNHFPPSQLVSTLFRFFALGARCAGAASTEEERERSIFSVAGFPFCFAREWRGFSGFCSALPQKIKGVRRLPTNTRAHRHIAHVLSSQKSAPNKIPDINQLDAKFKMVPL